MDELVSIIIPVYQVEPYLERCVRSVLAQTYQNLEILLIDDGSPDHCGEICDRFAQSDPRVTVYHLENSGTSAARNFGIAHCHGAYVAFIDADDYIAPDYIRYLRGLLTESHGDIACCCYEKTDQDTTAYGLNPAFPSRQVLTGKEACKALFGDLYDVLVPVWGKLFQREIVENWPFPVGRRYEDEAVICKYFYSAGKVAVGNACLYAYYENSGSFMHTREACFNEDQIWALRHRAEFFMEKNEPELAKLAWNMLIQHCLYETIHFHGRYDSVLKELWDLKELPPRTKLELRLYHLSPRIYKSCFKIKRMVTKPHTYYRESKDDYDKHTHQRQ